MHFDPMQEHPYPFVDTMEPEAARESGVGLLEPPSAARAEPLSVTLAEPLLDALLADVKTASATSPADPVVVAVPATPGRPDRLEQVAAVFGFAALGAAGLTVIGMMLLGPFGFFPVLFVGPLYAVSELMSWLARRLAPQAEPATPATPAASADRPTPPAEPIDAHLALPALLSRLELEQEPVCLTRQLERLRPLLAAHFTDEESNGLFDELLNLQPTLDVDLRLRAFEREHARMLDDLAGVGGCRGPADLYALRRRIVRDLRAHQQAEDALIQEVYGIYVAGPLSV